MVVSSLMQLLTAQHFALDGEPPPLIVAEANTLGAQLLHENLDLCLLQLTGQTSPDPS